MNTGCQVIKSNDQWCRNYARKGMTCCWPHRKFENDIPEIVPDKPKPFSEKVVEAESSPWPSLEEAQAEIKLYCISTLDGITSYAKAKQVLDLPKYEQRLVSLTISEAIMTITLPNESRFSVKNLLIVIVKKLLEAGYKSDYVTRLLDFHQSI